MNGIDSIRFRVCLERHFLRRQPLNWVNETTAGTWAASYIIYRSTRFSLARAVFFLRKVSCKVLKLHYVGEAEARRRRFDGSLPEQV